MFVGRERSSGTDSTSAVRGSSRIPRTTIELEYLPNYARVTTLSYVSHYLRPVFPTPWPSHMNMEKHDMRSLSIREVRAALGDIENLVEKEGELVITRHGKPVARIVPLKKRRLPSLKAWRDSMPFQEIPSEVLIREDREAR